MSLDINVYVEDLSDSIIPEILKRLNDFDMKVKIHPDFSFQTQTGFLPFKFTLQNSKFDILKDKELLSGFELYIDDYNFEEEKKHHRFKKNIFQKAFNKQTETEKRLSKCTKFLNFNWHLDNTFELRFALLTSAIITEITNGVRYYPVDDYWYENKNIVNQTFEDVKDFESSISHDRLRFHEFDGW
ncbi:hypothetical protein NYQ10_08455 [Flavobacterium johnsoniae]|uniref:hypothetical protein n=1 Tax=Flavobacterium johnsoniae TaxID=986 RepID=UPI0025B0FDDE|nr:hypothetical protein [Flavobacterium johnsoniae]WJS96480.1 hypothetical protein NYQ10_08455 [Flavobacterium johnsoniae]